MTSPELNLDVPDSGAVFAFGKNVPPKFYIRNDSVVSAACGEGHAVVVTSSGRVFGFGQNDYGQLGLGHRNSQLKPACVKQLRLAGLHALRVACGPTHTLVAVEGGRCFGFGNNSDGQLAGDAADLPEPVELEHLSGKEIKDVAAGRSFSLVLTKQGELYAWGSNNEGCLGQGGGLEESRDALVLIDLPERVAAVSAGAYHVACVLTDGQVYAWGESEGGKLGIPGSEEKEYFYVPQRVPLPDGQSARSVACGLQHTLVLTDTGRLLSCGTGDSGQLGLGADRLYAPLLTPVVAVDDVELTNVSAGERHSACVSGRSGHMFAFGDALHGKLGPSSRRGQTNQYRPFRAEALARLRIRRAVCGNLLTLVLAAPRSPDDPELAAADEAAGMADDPLDPMSAMSPRPLSRTLAAAGDADGSQSNSLLLRRSTRSRMKFRESAIARQTLQPSDSVDGGFSANGTATFELLRPRSRLHANNALAEEDIVKAKTQSAVECQPSIRIDSTTTEVAKPAPEKRKDGGSPDVPAAAENAAAEDEGPIPPHVMAITQFDNLLEPPGELSPDTDEEAAPENKDAAADQPMPKKRSEVQQPSTVHNEEEEPPPTYAEVQAKPRKRGSGKRKKPKLPPPPPPPPPPPQAMQNQQKPLPPSPALQQPSPAAAQPQLKQQQQQQQPTVAVKAESAAALPAAVDATAAATEEPQQQPPPAPEPIENSGAQSSGMTKGIGCGRGRRQQPPKASADTAATTAAPDASATTGEVPDPGKSENGTGGAVYGVGCGGRRRKPPATASSMAPTDKPSEATTATAEATPNGGEAVAAEGDANGETANGAKAAGGSRSCLIL